MFKIGPAGRVAQYLSKGPLLSLQVPELALFVRSVLYQLPPLRDQLFGPTDYGRCHWQMMAMFD